MKKLVLILSIFLTLSFVFSACEFDNLDLGNEENETPQAGKTPLYVGVYDGALGYEWAKQIEKMYEAANEDVDVIIRHKKNEYDDGQLLSKIEYNDEDIYFLSENNYDSYIANDLIADITDTVNEKIYDSNGDLTDNNPTKSILDTMWDDWKLLYEKDGGKYYAIPNFAPPAGITYDDDLFKEKGYSVPTTYTELKNLMNAMLRDSITPFTVAPNYHYVINNAALSFWANYEGKNNFFLNTTFKGTDSSLGEINYSNAYLLQQQEGKLASLQFLYDLASNSRYTTMESRSGQTHLNSQDSFVTSINTVDSGKNRVAMILENSYWEREAKATIDMMGEYEDSWGWGKRNFKFMIAPVDKNVQTNTVYCSSSASFTCISANSKRLDLAKDFLQFVQSRKGLAVYTQYTGSLRAFDYDLTDEEYNACTLFTQSLVDLMRRDDVEFVTFGTGNPVAKQITDFGISWMVYTVTETEKSAVDNTLVQVSTRSPFGAFMSFPTLTPQKYYDGGMNYMSEEIYTQFYNNV